VWDARSRLLEYLLQLFNPNSRDCHGNTVLHTLVQYIGLANHNRTIALLLDRGLDPSLRNNDGKTPLDIAKEKDRKSIIPLVCALTQT
jgi:ankyrin repeat protein